MPDAGRVIAGTAGGRRLRAPGEGTRPLADRVKQTLFAVLEPDLPGAAVLDLCAGSGAAGIEALSRGARLAVFVERDAGATRIIALDLSRPDEIDPVAVGTRKAMPSNNPLSSGIVSVVATAAPVEAGIIFSAAARARRMSLCELSCRF